MDLFEFVFPGDDFGHPEFAMETCTSELRRSPDSRCFRRRVSRSGAALLRGAAEFFGVRGAAEFDVCAAGYLFGVAVFGAGAAGERMAGAGFAAGGYGECVVVCVDFSV